MDEIKCFLVHGCGVDSEIRFCENKVVVVNETSLEWKKIDFVKIKVSVVICWSLTLNLLLKSKSYFEDPVDNFYFNKLSPKEVVLSKNANCYHDDPVDGLLLQKIRLFCSEVVWKEVKIKITIATTLWINFHAINKPKQNTSMTFIINENEAYEV